jgi:hypothetical protein
MAINDAKTRAPVDLKHFFAPAMWRWTLYPLGQVDTVATIKTQETLVEKWSSALG